MNIPQNFFQLPNETVLQKNGIDFETAKDLLPYRIERDFSLKITNGLESFNLKLGNNIVDFKSATSTFKYMKFEITEMFTHKNGRCYSIIGNIIFQNS